MTSLSWRYPQIPWFGFKPRITIGDHINKIGPIKWWIVKWLVFAFTITKQDKWRL